MRPAAPGSMFSSGTTTSSKNRAEVTEARKLPSSVGDLASLKKAVADTGATCKACHDDYRAK